MQRVSREDAANLVSQLARIATFEARGIVHADQAYLGIASAVDIQEFANRAGFSSKGFMADVIAGRKRPTAASLARVQVGLKLNTRRAEYLKCLVACEESTERIKDESYYREKIVALRQKLLQQRSIERLKPGSVAEVFLQPNFPGIYAALGTCEVGAAIDEIIARTRLSREQIRATISAMGSVGIVAIRADGAESDINL